MASVNKVILVGNLGKRPELKYLQNGVALCSIGLATTDHWTDQSGQRHEKTEWHQLSIWKKNAELVAKYCDKGSQIYVEGRLQTRSWDDPTSGQKRYQTDVVVDVVRLLGAPRSREESPPANTRPRSGKQPNIQGDFGTGEFGDIPY